MKPKEKPMREVKNLLFNDINACQIAEAARVTENGHETWIGTTQNHIGLIRYNTIQAVIEFVLNEFKTPGNPYGEYAVHTIVAGTPDVPNHRRLYPNRHKTNTTTEWLMQQIEKGE